MDTPAETSDLISGQEVRRVQVPRVRIIPHISFRSILEKGECSEGAMGVWSPHAREFLTTRPCNIIIGAQTSLGGRTIPGEMLPDPGVLTSPVANSGNVAVEQCKKEEMRLEKKGAKRKEL